MRNDELAYQAREALCSYLQAQPCWDAFFTVTFKRPIRHTWSAIDRTAHALLKSGRIGRAFIASERHLSGDFHTHGLVAYLPLLDGSPGEYSLEMAVTKSNFNRLGWSMVAHPRAVGQVTGYCAKYLTKANVTDCEYDFLGTEWTRT